MHNIIVTFFNCYDGNVCGDASRVRFGIYKAKVLITLVTQKNMVKIIIEMMHAPSSSTIKKD